MESKRVNLLNTEWTQHTSSQSLRNLLKVQRYFHTILRHTASLSFHCEGLGPGTLCCSATISAPRHSSPQQQNTKKSRNHMGLSTCAVKQIIDKRYKGTKKPTCHFWRAWSKKAGGQELKQGTVPGPCTQCHLRGGQTSPTPGHTPALTPHSTPSRSKPAREPVDCSHLPLLQQGPQQSLTWISCLASE